MLTDMQVGCYCQPISDRLVTDRLLINIGYRHHHHNHHFCFPSLLLFFIFKILFLPILLHWFSDLSYLQAGRLDKEKRNVAIMCAVSEKPRMPI